MKSASTWRRISLLTAVVGAFLGAGCATMGGGSVVPAGSDSPVIGFAEAGNAGIQNRWVCQVPVAQSRGEQIAGLSRQGDTLYVLTTDNILYSVNAKAGTMNWSKPADLGGHHVPFFPPQEIRNGASLLLMNETWAFLVDKRDGNVTQRASLGFAARTTPLVVGTDIVVGSAAGYFYGLFIDLLAKRNWSVWNRNDSFEAAPVVVMGRDVAFASRTGQLWEVEGHTGQAVWKDRKVNGEVVGGLATDDTLVYIPCLDNKVYAFDALNGNHLWDTHVDGILDQTPFLHGKTLLVVGSGFGLCAMTTNKGEVKWTCPGISQVVATSGNKVFAADKGGTLYQIAADTGVVQSKLPVAYAKKFLTNAIDGGIFVITADGRLAAFDEVK